MEALTVTAFSDEMEKISAEFDREKAKRVAKVIGGTLAGAAVAGGALIAARPALRAHVGNLLKSIGKNKRTKEEVAALPAEVVQHAKQIAEALKAKGIDPATARIAISGTGGSGKSTLARALSKEMGMGVRSLDTHIAGGTERFQGRALTKYFKRNEVPPGMVMDQTHLLNQVDPDKFDVIIRVHRPMDVIQKQILRRGRSAGQLDFYNYPKLDKSIEAAFSNTSGNTMHIAPGVQVKVKPKGGFQADQILDEKLILKGFNPYKMERSQKILAVAHGEKGGAGVAPYVRKRNLVAAGGIVGGAAGAGGYTTARYTEQKPREYRR